MSEVKRYAPDVRAGAHNGMRPWEYGGFVLHSDYAAVKAERDELARALAARGYFAPDYGDARKMCCGCNVWNSDHAPGCPVALAERITKEAGDGR